MKKIGLVSLFLSALLSLNVNAAGDQKVNCTTVSSQMPYYYGNAQCFTSGRWLNQYFSNSITATVWLREQVLENGRWVTYQCSTTLPSTGFTTVNQEQCQYTPKAIVRQHYVEERYDSRTDTTYYRSDLAVAAFEYSDRDGQVQTIEKWVNGVSVSSGHVDVYEPTQVRLRVTDNDGHVTDTTSTISPPGSAYCTRGGIAIICEDF